MLDVSFKACAALGEAWGSEFPLDVGSLSWEWGLWQDHLSVSPAYLIVGFLSFAWCIGVTQLVFDFFFFEGNCSVCNCRFSVSMYLVCRLELEP